MHTGQNTLFIINDGPYGNERAYNALRLALKTGGSVPGEQLDDCVQQRLTVQAGTARSGYLKGRQ